MDVTADIAMAILTEPLTKHQLPFLPPRMCTSFPSDLVALPKDLCIRYVHCLLSAPAKTSQLPVACKTYVWSLSSTRMCYLMLCCTLASVKLCQSCGKKHQTFSALLRWEELISVNYMPFTLISIRLTDRQQSVPNLFFVQSNPFTPQTKRIA